MSTSRRQQDNALPRIALVGDHNPEIVAHRGIAASLAGRAAFDWLMTEQLPADATAMRQLLAGYQAVWCIPGSPYRNMAAALTAIRVAREDGIPFFGSCGGFQHAVIEGVSRRRRGRDRDQPRTGALRTVRRK